MMTSYALTYHAWTWLEPGEPEQLRLVEQVVAPPGPGEILVRNTMIALNPVDWKVIAQGPADWKLGQVSMALGSSRRSGTA